MYKGWTMKTFTIKKDFITLVQFLKVEGLIGSGGEARHFMDHHKITLNDQQVTEKKKKIFAGNVLKIDEETITFQHD